MHPTPRNAGRRTPERAPEGAPPALPGNRRRRLLVRIWLGLTIAAAAVAAAIAANVAPKSMPELSITTLSGARWVALLGPFLALLMILGVWRLVYVALRGSESRPRRV